MAHKKGKMRNSSSVADPGRLFRIPDPIFSIPDHGFRVKKSRIRIRIKEFKYFNSKIFSKLSEI
jgi:hypothetical protein